MSYCKVFALGRLGKDVPDLRYTPKGTPVAEFSIATERMVNEEKKVTWLDLVCFGKTAESCKQYLTKGTQVFVEGTLQTDKFQNSLGMQLSKTRVIVERIRFLGAPKNHETVPAEDWEPGEDG
ncbi:MAG TPA: single-stranded DNA-binding protein [Candidatus Acidoferrales bacterium]|nr:single-stranded DNA-binding protein [Candidatus Acidoferrales bacterium]